VADPNDISGILDCAIGSVGNEWLNHAAACHDAEKEMNSHLKTESINLLGQTWRYYVVEGSDPVLYRGFQLKRIERVFKFKMQMDDLPSQERVAGLMGLFDELCSVGFVAMKHWELASTYGPGFANPGTFPPLPKPRIGDIMYSEAEGLLFDVVNVNDSEYNFQYKSNLWNIGFKPFEDKKYEISVDDTISEDDPIRKPLRLTNNVRPVILTDAEVEGSVRSDAPVDEVVMREDGEYLFATPRKAIEDNARLYKPADVELPPNNDKDNPFPRF